MKLDRKIIRFIVYVKEDNMPEGKRTRIVHIKDDQHQRESKGNKMQHEMESGPESVVIS